MLTAEQKKLIQESYIYIARREYSTGELFYERLFEIAPELKPLFPSEMKDMRLKFIQTIGGVVASLDSNEDAPPGIAELGKRHVCYGVKKEHYPIFGAAFIWALEKALEDRFTPEVREAWVAFYNMIAEAAIRAAYG